MRIVEIIRKDAWINDYDFFREFKKSKYFSILLDTYENLNTEILFQSKVHGQGHIERVILFSMLLAWYYELDNDDTDLMRYAASLHDICRENDGYDTEHGRRAADICQKYAKIKQSDIPLLKAIITSHSTDDSLMEEVIKSYEIKDFDRALFLAKLFKDADGLDRVRINRLDDKYLRNDFSKNSVGFAYELFENYWFYWHKSFYFIK